MSLDPSNLLPHDIRAKFRSLLDEYNHIFDPNINGYNGVEGPFEARGNLGSCGTYPMRRQASPICLLPTTGTPTDVWWAWSTGRFERTKDINIPVEYLNPSFLHKKPSSRWCLVTAFADVGRYSKPQSFLMPDVDSMLRLIALWKHIIATDLTSRIYQIALSRNSVKYCGVTTPF